MMMLICTSQRGQQIKYEGSNCYDVYHSFKIIIYDGQQQQIIHIFLALVARYNRCYATSNIH
jgi:hypothetical protein